MSQSPESSSGFDRRSLIKKGLVAGGAVAALPVISTFNAPAFAASPGTFYIFYRINPIGGNAIREAPGGAVSTACAPAGWSYNDPGDGEIDIDASQGGNVYTFQLNEPDCTFTDTGITGIGPICGANDPTIVDADTVVADGSLLGNLLGRGIFLEVTCT